MKKRLLLLTVMIGLAITGICLFSGKFKTAAAPPPVTPATKPASQPVTPASKPVARGDLAVAERLLRAARSANQQAADPRVRQQVEPSVERLLALAAALAQGQAGDFSAASSLIAAQPQLVQIDDHPAGRMFGLLAGFDALSGLDTAAMQQTDQARLTFLVAHALLKAGNRERAIALMTRAAAGNFVLYAMAPGNVQIGRTDARGVPAEALLTVFDGDAAIDTAAKTTDPADRASNLLALASHFIERRQSGQAKRAVELAAAAASLMPPAPATVDARGVAQPIVIWATLGAFQHRLGDTAEAKKSVAAAIAAAKAMPANGGMASLGWAAVVLGRCDAFEEGEPLFEVVAADQDMNNPSGWLAQAGDYERAVRVLGGDPSKVHATVGSMEPKTPGAAQRYLKAFGAQPRIDPQNDARHLESTMVRAIALAGDAEGALKRAGAHPGLIQAAIGGRIAADDLDGALRLLNARPELPSRGELTDMVALRKHSLGDSVAAAELMISHPYSWGLSHTAITIARACIQTRRFDLALKLMAKCDPIVYETITRMLVDAGEFELAIAAVNSAERRTHTLPYVLANAYARSGKPAEAEAVYQKLNDDIDQRPWITARVAEQWARTDPLAAEKWAGALTNPDTRALALLAAARSVFSRHDSADSLALCFGKSGDPNPLLE